MSPERTLYIGASTKAYLSYARSREWLTEVRAAVDARPLLGTRSATTPDASPRSGSTSHRIVPFVIPSTPVLADAARTIAGSAIELGAQDVSFGSGALTGETPAAMLAEIGVTIAELGHAERRSIFGESDEVIAQKFVAASNAGLTALLCVGEPNRTTVSVAAETCFAQVVAVVPETYTGRLLIAYEPVWAIGADRPADPHYVSDVVAELRQSIHARYGGLDASILYGGSAGPGLLRTLDGVDGLFLGRFAHDVDGFAAVLDEALELIAQPSALFPSIRYEKAVS